MENTGIVVLSHATETAPFSEESAKRVDLGVALYGMGISDSVVLSGGYHGPHAVGKFSKAHADAMLEYGLSLEVPRHAFLLEDRSIDTVGQAVFSLRDFVRPRKWSSVRVVTSDYHTQRTQKIFSRLFDVDVDVYGVVTELHNRPDVLEREQRSIEAFERTFEGVKTGDIDGMVETLFTKHPLYARLERILK